MEKKSFMAPSLSPTPSAPFPDAGEIRLLVSGGPLWVLVHERMAREILEGRPVILLCADNGLDTDLLVRKAREAGHSPESLLSCLYVSRAFTVHQLLATVTGRLEREREKSGSDLVVLSGILPLFSDAAIPSGESLRLLGALLDSFKNLARKGLRILLPVPLPIAPGRRAKSVLSPVLHAASLVETALRTPAGFLPVRI